MLLQCAVAVQCLWIAVTADSFIFTRIFVILQCKGYAADELVEFDILLALSNNLELHEESTTASQALRDRAAVYRQHLITAMIGMGRQEPTECAICTDTINAKAPTQIAEGFKHRLVVLPCCHVFHHGCVLEWNKTNFTCPTCREPLMLFIS